jgi:hypothetical protein
LSNSLFSQEKISQVKLKALVGGKVILSAIDGFGVCAMGGKGYEGDMFLIFR